jgi:hypothetical protein
MRGDRESRQTRRDMTTKSCGMGMEFERRTLNQLNLGFGHSLGEFPLFVSTLFLSVIAFPGCPQMMRRANARNSGTEFWKWENGIYSFSPFAKHGESGLDGDLDF